MNKLAMLFAAAVLGTSPAIAEPDHLIPEDSLISGGRSEFFGAQYDYIHRAFQDGYARNVVVRVVVLPSFSAERLIGIRKLGDAEKPAGYEAFYLSATGLGFARYEDSEAAEKAGPPPPPEQAKLVRCGKPLPTQLAARIVSLWQAVLLDTHYDPQGGAGLDGVDFHFYALGKYQELAGWAWSPDEKSAPGMLAMLANTLQAYCDGQAAAADLEKQADALAKKMTP